MILLCPVYKKRCTRPFWPKSPVYAWKFEDVPETGIRIYYKPKAEEGMGFDFYAAENTGYICNEHTAKDEWHTESCHVECVFYGIAYFDGIRHLYYGCEQTENYGYHYYANLVTIVDALNKLKELEKKYCRDSE